MGSLAYVAVDRSFRVLLLIPTAMAIHAVLMAVDKGRLTASGFAECGAVLNRPWSWIPGLYLWRRATALGEPEPGELPRQWILVTAMSSFMFAVALLEVTRDLSGPPPCPRTLETGGLASIYRSLATPGREATTICTGSFPDGRPTGQAVRFQVERYGDDVLVSMRHLNTR